MVRILMLAIIFTTGCTEGMKSKTLDALNNTGIASGNNGNTPSQVPVMAFSSSPQSGGYSSSVDDVVFNYDTDLFFAGFYNLSDEAIACAAGDALDPNHPAQDIDFCDDYPLTEYTPFMENRDYLAMPALDENGAPTGLYNYIYIGPAVINGHPYIIRGEFKYVVYDPASDMTMSGRFRVE